MPPPSAIDLDLTRLETELKRLEAEYTMFFSGRSPKPPVETRNRVEALIRQYDRAHIANYGSRFRFSTLQSRYAKLTERWDRGLRAKEEGRAGPFVNPRQEPSSPEERAASRTVKVATFQDPRHEKDQLRALYDSLAAARRANGEEAVPFRRFAELVTKQVSTLQKRGSGEVAFKVGVKDGKVTFTAKAVKGEKT